MARKKLTREQNHEKYMKQVKREMQRDNRKQELDEVVKYFETLGCKVVKNEKGE